MKVPGIGPSKAKEIIEYKNQKGSFNSIDDLKNIKGFGSKHLKNLKNILPYNDKYICNIILK